jgi:hypothetical protein
LGHALQTEFQVLGLPSLVAMLVDDLNDVEEGTPFDLMQPLNAGFLDSLDDGFPVKNLSHGSAW